MSSSKQSLTDSNLRIIRNPSPDLSNSPLSDSSKELTWSDVEHVDDNRMTHSQLLGTSHESIPEENVLFPDPQPMNVIITPTFQEASTNTDEHNTKQDEDDNNNEETKNEGTNNEETKENIQTETKQESNQEPPSTELPAVTITDIDVRQLIRNAVAEAFCEVIGDVLKTIKEMEQTADENVKNDEANDVAKQPMEEDPYADMPALVEDVTEPSNEQHETEENPAKESDSQDEHPDEQEIDMYENGKIAIYEVPSCKRCATVLDLLLSHQQNKLMKRLRGIEEPEDESITEDSEEDWETEETNDESSTDDSTSDDNASEDEASAESSEQYSSDTTASSDSEKRTLRFRRRYKNQDVPPMITFCFVLLMCLYMVRLISMMYEPAAYTYYRIHYS